MQKITAAVTVLRRLPTSLGALPLGMIMGFLPCGFLYAMTMRTRMIRLAGIMIALMGSYNLYRHLQIPGCCSLLFG